MFKLKLFTQKKARKQKQNFFFIYNQDIPIIKVQSVEEPDKEKKDSLDGEDVPEILRKIPEGAEAFAVLVGAVDFLDHPVMGFVRLSEGNTILWLWLLFSLSLILCRIKCCRCRRYCVLWYLAE